MFFLVNFPSAFSITYHNKNNTNPLITVTPMPQVIKQPIDLEKVLQKWRNNAYPSLDDIMADLTLMFQNACRYNEPDSQIYRDALTLQRHALEARMELDFLPHPVLSSLFCAVLLMRPFLLPVSLLQNCSLYFSSPPFFLFLPPFLLTSVFLYVFSSPSSHSSFLLLHVFPLFVYLFTFPILCSVNAYMFLSSSLSSLFLPTLRYASFIFVHLNAFPILCSVSVFK